MSPVFLTGVFLVVLLILVPRPRLGRRLLLTRQRTNRMCIYFGMAESFSRFEIVREEL